MKVPAAKRATHIHDETWGVNIFKGDAAWIMALIKATGKSRSEALRELLHESIVARQMSERGRTDSDERHRQLQREAVHLEIDPLRRDIDRLNTQLLQLKALVENTFVKAGEATDIGFECLHRIEGVYIICEKNLTLPNLIDEGMSAQQIKDQLRINRNGFADAMVEVARSVQARSRRLLAHNQPTEAHKEDD